VIVVLPPNGLRISCKLQAPRLHNPSFHFLHRSTAPEWRPVTWRLSAACSG
jgi:hypothetical protein